MATKRDIDKIMDWRNQDEKPKEFVKGKQRVEKHKTVIDQNSQQYSRSNDDFNSNPKNSSQGRRRSSKSTGMHDDAIHRGETMSRKNQAKKTVLYVVTGEKVYDNRNLKHFLLHRMNNPIDLDFSVTHVADIKKDGRMKHVIHLQFESFNKASLGKHLLHKSNRNVPNKLICSLDRGEAIGEVVDTAKQRQEQIEKADKAVIERADIFLERHDVKINEIRDKITDVQTQLTSKNGVSLLEFDKLTNENFALEDKLEELGRQRKEFKRYIQCLKDKLQSLLTCEKFAKEMEEVRTAFGVECRRFSTALPMYARREDILNTIRENQVCVILGETGSGKSTQMVQYLYQSGLAAKGQIVCTQPRNIAAVSLATHVAAEMASRVGQIVGYKVGMQKKSTAITKVMYMTDHILLNECLVDRLLQQYSCILIDEAHERSIYTDLLLGMLKETINKRPELKIIITSATIEPGIFVKYFGGKDRCPVLKVSGRAFPVDVFWEHNYFSERNFPEDYETKAFNKAIEIHESTPIDEGDILVFLTAVAEIERCAEKLKERGDADVHCLQLHGRLKTEEQQLVFEKSPRGKRKIVFATNSAETSITIPGIKFVVDTGVAKEMRFDPRKNMNSLNVVSISQSSANQRKGRAGRMSSGICYRLYSEEDYNNMEKTACPEILRIQVSQALLKLLELGVDPMKFDYVQSPSHETMRSAMDELTSIGATNKDGISELGKWIAKLPVEPKLGLLIKKGVDANIVTETLVVASCCNQSGIFYRVGTLEEKRAADLKKMKFCHRGGDLLTMLNVFREWNKVPEKEKGMWCDANSINGKAIKSVRDMTNEISSILKKDLGLKIKYEFKQEEGVDLHVQHLLFECMTSNLGFFLGHEGAGYIIVNRNQRVKLHPSCAILALGLQPSWVVFNKVLKTSEDYMTEVTPISNKIVTANIKSGKLNADINALENQKLKQALRLFVGRHVLWKFVGPFHHRRRSVEEDIAAACDGCMVVVEANKNRGEISLFCLSQYVEKASALLRLIIEPMPEQLLNESREENIGDERSGVRAVLRKGGRVVEVLMPHEYRSLNIVKKDRPFEQNLDESSVREMLNPYGPIEQIWRPTGNRHNLNQFWGKITFIHQNDAIAACQRVNDDVNADIKLEPNTFQSTRTKQGFTMKISWCRRPSKGHCFVTAHMPEDRPLILMSSPTVNGVPVSISLSKRSDIFIKNLPADVTDDNVKKALAEVLGMSVSTCKDRFNVVIPRTNVIWNHNERTRQQNELSRILSKYVDREVFRINVREYKQQTVMCVAFVTFSDPQLCNDTATQLLRRQETINGHKLQVNVECRSSFHIKKGLYDIVEDDLHRTIDQLAHANIYLNLKTLKSGHFSLEIKADTPLQLDQAKLRFQDIIGGDTFCWEEKENLKVMFTKNGRQRVQEIEKETNTMIIVDERDMRVSVQGLISNRKNAVALIEEYMKINSNTEEKVINLKGEDNPPGLMKELLVKYGISFEDLRKETDVSRIELHLRHHEIVVTGKSEAVEKVYTVIKEIKEEFVKMGDERKIQENLSDCPICLCPVNELDMCRLEYCGHAYCKVCLTSLIRNAITSKQIPVSCAVENCNKLLVIRDFNTQIKMRRITRKDLLDSALSCLVNSQGKDFRFCITPDCNMVYRVTTNGTLFSCPACRTNICTTCHIQYHEGLTCSMYNVAKKEGNSMLEWIKEDPSNRKLCPNCEFGIEKSGGCNHLQCTLCRSNICWACMAFFPQVNECYKHMEAAHRSFV